MICKIITSFTLFISLFQNQLAELIKTKVITKNASRYKNIITINILLLHIFSESLEDILKTGYFWLLYIL